MLIRTIPAILTAALLAAAPSARYVPGQTAPPRPAPASEARAAAADHTGTKQVVEVRLTEYRIEMPDKLAAGPTVFKVTNTGGMYHEFEIEGKGLEKEVEDGLDAGETKTLELDLRPGAYEIYCPVHGHRKAGMALKVQVS